jgi:hypothetical protein
LTTNPGACLPDPRQRLGGAGYGDIAAEQEVCAAGADADGADVLGPGRYADVAEDGPALLGKTGHVDHPASPAFQVGGHRQDRADGDHAGSADAGDEDVVGAVDPRQDGIGEHHRR